MQDIPVGSMEIRTQLASKVSNVIFALQTHFVFGSILQMDLRAKCDRSAFKLAENGRLERCYTVEDHVFDGR